MKQRFCWIPLSGQTSEQFPDRVKRGTNRSVRPQPQTESRFEVFGHLMCPTISGLTMLTWAYMPTGALNTHRLKGITGSTIYIKGLA